MNTTGSVFPETIEQVGKIKFKKELIEMIDFFLDCYSDYAINLAAFNFMSLSSTQFVYPGGFCNGYLVVQMK